MNYLYTKVSAVREQLILFANQIESLDFEYNAVVAELEQSFTDSKGFWERTTAEQKDTASHNAGVALERLNEMANGLNLLDVQLSQVDQSYAKRRDALSMVVVPNITYQTADAFLSRMEAIAQEAKKIASECSLTVKQDMALLNQQVLPKSLWVKPSPYNYVSETIELLDDQLIDIQIRYLLDVINVHNVQKKNSYNWQISYFDIKRKWMSINNKSSLFEYCNNLLASIQSAVSNCTLNEELELYFAPVKDSRTGRYSMDIMKDALYSGRYGVQIFLEMYYHFYGFEQRKKALENRVLKMANDFYLNTNEMKWFNLSFTNGVASLLMELRNFALISNRNSFVEMIFKIIKSIPEKNITRSEESDYYNGIAGLLYIICDCYKKFNVDIDLYARNLIEYIVTDLFKRCDICGLWFQEEFYHQPLTGLAHGQSGYALALSKALPYINEGMRLKVTSQIQKCMDYEYNCYDNSEMNLPDYRKLLLKKGGDKSQKKFMYGYCSGILGTALVVSELSEELISFQKKEIWKMNAVQYLKKDILIGNDSLCCGTAGWIDYLASCHKNEEWSDELLKKIIFSINEQGYVFNGLEGVNEISLFKGMSGIGYSVLRYMGKYPSVLL